ncbi:MAG: polysaccharide deacetylase family protein [Luteolibacter sp.]
MKLFQAIGFIGFACAVSAFGQSEDTGEVSTSQPLRTLDIPDDGVRVAVLGYHDFSTTERETAMRIRSSKFREQMETIKKSGIPVISMTDFIAWKDDGKSIPEKAIVITLDDGWKSVYTDAYPVLKEFGFPFTIYLYKNYVDGGGKALTTEMIREMIANGATIGSHSVSHPFPQTVKNSRKKGAEAYDKFLNVEMGESKDFLEEKFKQPVTTYAYPGGYFTEEMLLKAEQVGYGHLFTVQPGKVKRSIPNNILPRYVILGNYDKIFDYAMSFRDSQTATEATIDGLVKELPHPVEPQPGAIINTRLPVISVNLSGVDNIDPESLVMQVAGFGDVPANYANEGGILSWRVNRPLRQPVCRVKVSWKTRTGDSADSPIEWGFQIDRGAAYLPDE